MIDCKIKMPPEGKEVLLRLGYLFGVGYGLNVNDKPLWLAGVAIPCEFDKGTTLIGEPIAWSYLPVLTPQPAKDSYIC